MKFIEPLSIRVAKTLSYSLKDSVTPISIKFIADRVQSSTIDVTRVVNDFSTNGMARLEDDQIYLTENGLAIGS